jgi:hypothetical protein
MADESVPLVPTVPLDKTMEAIAGFVKANTSDLLGAPADIAYATSKVLSRNSEPAKPEYGSDYFRKIFFGPDAVETKSLTEVGGSLVSPGGVMGVGKAMIVGAIPKLALSGVSAKSAMKILTRVDELQTSEDAVKFFQTAGVFKGVEGMPRAAISDATAGLKTENFSKLPEIRGKIDTVLTTDKNLGEILDHPELYKLYPQLKEYKVNARYDLPRNSAEFNPKTKEINLGPQDSLNTMFSSVLHETQHAVQELEGFTAGTNPNTMREFKAVELTKERLDNLRKLRDEGNPHAEKIANMLNADTRTAFQKYQANPSEAEARFTE